MHLKLLLKETNKSVSFLFQTHIPWVLAIYVQDTSGIPIYNISPTNLSSEVLQNCSTVHCSSGTDPSVTCGASLQMSVDAAHGKLKETIQMGSTEVLTSRH